MLDWLDMAILYTARGGTPLVDYEDPFGNNEDVSGMLDEETSKNEHPLPKQPDLSCGNNAADSNKGNMLPLQGAASFGVWSSYSTTLDNKSPDDAGRSATELTSYLKEAVESLLQLSHGDAPIAANPPVDADRRLPDDDASLTKPKQLDGYSNNGGEGSRPVQAKRHRFEDTYKPRKRNQYKKEKR
ncbi:hypothetical protein E0Z10_g10296 [Xylaria hypoxylon]|uniref:Uncharacterized protein n=1 Tax=Xylaria hypoxylon TaxID=37992 RepID=A0A4Z0YLC1_9PEZI|nr:hypothetical protein E0Z10_g10296 [Xylaria hypoxylon]